MLHDPGASLTATKPRRNRARGALLAESLFVLVGGLGIALFPEEACERMAALRGLAEGHVRCPSYAGAHPVFEMYNFSLGKHQALIAIVFAWFSVFGRSRTAIDAGLVYWPVAAALDVVPVLTWFSANDLVASAFPRIIVLALVFTLVAAFALPANARHPEW